MIRASVHQDIDEIFRIELASFPTPWSKKGLLEEFEAPHSKIFVFEEEDSIQSKISGYICYHVVMDEMHILKIAVAPSARRKKIASKLLANAIEIEKRNGCRIAYLEARASNRVAHTFYHASGFRPIATRKGYYNDFNSKAEDAIIYKKIFG